MDCLPSWFFYIKRSWRLFFFHNQMCSGPPTHTFEPFLNSADKPTSKKKKKKSSKFLITRGARRRYCSLEDEKYLTFTFFPPHVYSGVILAFQPSEKSYSCKVVVERLHYIDMRGRNRIQYVIPKHFHPENHSFLCNFQRNFVCKCCNRHIYNIKRIQFSFQSHNSMNSFLHWI